MTANKPTVYGQYIVTGHRFEYTIDGNNQPMTRVLLHQHQHQAAELPAHSALVPNADLDHPAYQLGAVWELTYSGRNARDEEEDY